MTILLADSPIVRESWYYVTHKGCTFASIQNVLQSAFDKGVLAGEAPLQARIAHLHDRIADFEAKLVSAHATIRENGWPSLQSRIKELEAENAKLRKNVMLNHSPECHVDGSNDLMECCTCQTRRIKELEELLKMVYFYCHATCLFPGNKSKCSCGAVDWNARVAKLLEGT